jgi:hypothetical protein
MSLGFTQSPRKKLVRIKHPLSRVILRGLNELTCVENAFKTQRY